MSTAARIITRERLELMPGWEIVSEGIADATAGRVSPAACIVWIAWPRLRRAGLVTDEVRVKRVLEPERMLYRLLRETSANAYGSYQTLLRRVRRFEHALDREMFARPATTPRASISD